MSFLQKLALIGVIWTALTAAALWAVQTLFARRGTLAKPVSAAARTYTQWACFAILVGVVIWLEATGRLGLGHEHPTVHPERHTEPQVDEH